MLMAHESRVTPTIRNSGGSEGFMQLNSHPVRDLGKRFQLYAPLLEKIQLEDLPKNTPRSLIELIQSSKNSQTKSPEHLRAITAELIKLRGHPIVNLVIGNIFLKFHELRAQRVVDANRTSSSNNALHKISHSPELLQSIYKKVRDIYPSASPEKIAASLSQIQGSKDLLKEYISLRNYNGNVAAKHGLEYRDIYASTVLVADLLQKNSLAAQARKPEA